ncbi:MAG TPA: TraR/DksA C4-type zinc finger protein [Bacillota bacterium]|nr:TraR/DksA C4-type zinc finger protein [Bacillota bacterium]
MDNLILNEFKERLTAEKNRLEEELRRSDRFNLDENLAGTIAELSSYDNHPADLGSETFEREKDLALWNNSHEILNRINDALNRINQGQYGICEECGAEIAIERLNAIPYTTMCIHCQQVNESHRQTRGRPIEEEVLFPPFSRTFIDDVAKYGTSETPSDLSGAEDYAETFYNAEEKHGVVEAVDGIIDVGYDQIPPDPV